MKKLLIFHPTIAPYRIDLFNDLYVAYNTTICLYYENLKDQKFKYDDISRKFLYTPDYFKKSITILGREIPVGFVSRIRETNPDIVIVNEYAESYWLAFLYKLFFRKKYKILTICDDSVDIVKNEGGLHAKARKMALRHIDGVILCNPNVQNIYRENYPSVKTFVMPIIQDESKFFEGKKDEIIDRAKEIATQEQMYGRRIYLYVGRISPEKNPLYLVESFIYNHEKNQESVLYLIGDSLQEHTNYDNEIEKYIRENKAESYIKKIGRKEGLELRAWFYLSQILVVPSKREAFGAVTNEALLCGDYVMLSSVAGSTCLVDEDNGEIIDVQDDVIDFSKMNDKIPVLSESYIVGKKSKMNCSYRKCMDDLVKWIYELDYINSTIRE